MARRQGDRPLRVLLTGGGTGGHVYPTLSVYDIIKEHWKIDRVLYLGSRGRAEEQIVPRYGIPMAFTPCAPLFGLGVWKLLISLMVNFFGTLRALWLLLRFRPHIILAAGGYVSAPAVFASFLIRPFLNPLLVIDEQNVVPGLMNKLASVFARVVLVSFRETAFFVWNSNCVLTGYPVRREFLDGPERSEARQALGIPEDRTVVTVFGGSMGARSINRLLAEVFPELAARRKDLAVYHSTGMARGSYEAWAETAERFRAGLPPDVACAEEGEGLVFSAAGKGLEYHLRPYIHDMALHLRASDLVVCRGGAGALSEVMALGKAALVIPKRDLPGDHQELNAISLAATGGCETVFERKSDTGVDFVDAAEFSSVFFDLLDSPARRETMGALAREHFPEGCREKTVATLRSLLDGQPFTTIQELEEPEYVRLQKQVDNLVRFLLKQPAGSFYHRFYSIRMEECLRSGRWETVNRGVKLCGGLRRIDKIPRLLELFRHGNGFLRRNVLTAFIHMGHEFPELKDLVVRALKDSYFEVRSEAVQLAAAFQETMVREPEIAHLMCRRMHNPLERFDVRYWCIRTLPLFVSLDSYFRLARKYRFARNVKFREAILEGIGQAVDKGRIPQSRGRDVRVFLNDFLVTTSGFDPKFKIRSTYRELTDMLERGGGKK